MNRVPELMTNEYNDVRGEINNFMIAVKLHQLEKNDEKYEKAKLRHPLPTIEECDILHGKLTEIINKFDKPIRRRY